MPEGDTIHNAAARLRPALVGRTLVRFDAARHAGSRPQPGVEITAVDAVGKHLLVTFADGHVLRTHLRMSGRWDLYAPGQRWRKPPYLARAVIEVPGAVAVCFSAPVVEITRGPKERGADGTGRAAGTAPAVAHLGPDLCLVDPDLDAALARMRAQVDPATGIDDVLLDQRVAAGIGNVYKSEVLWAERVHPRTPLGALDDDARRALLATAAKLLRANLKPGRRTTVSGPPGSVAVYGRSRRPCRRCGTPIRWARTGAMPRSTYWCPRCQPEPTPAPI
jgi:endonuclease-8